MAYTFERTKLYVGPGLVTFGAKTFYPKDDISLSLELAEPAIDTPMFGVVDQETDDVTAKITFTPLSLWDYISVLVPTFYRSATIGARLVDAGDDAALVWGANTGDLFSVKSAAVTKPPTLTLGAGQDVFSSVELTGVVENAKQLVDADSIFSHAAGQANPGVALDLTTNTRERWTGSWGSVTGFVDFEPKDAFTLEIQPNLTPIPVQGLTRDWQLDGLTIGVRCIPVGPTSANIKAAQAGFGAGWPQGFRRSGGSVGNLILTSASAKTITIKRMVMQRSGYLFGRALRAGEIAWTSIASFTGAALDPVLTIA